MNGLSRDDAATMVAAERIGSEKQTSGPRFASRMRAAAFETLTALPIPARTYLRRSVIGLPGSLVPVRLRRRRAGVQRACLRPPDRRPSISSSVNVFDLRVLRLI